MSITTRSPVAPSPPPPSPASNPNAMPRPTTSTIAQDRNKRRSRTSLACIDCRKRRTKCIRGENESACDYCIQHDLECIVGDTDERKRPSSKAHVRALTERIKALESMLPNGGRVQSSNDSSVSLDPLAQANTNANSSEQVHNTLLASSGLDSRMESMEWMTAFRDEGRASADKSQSAPVISSTRFQARPYMAMSDPAPPSYSDSQVPTELFKSRLQYVGPCANFHAYPHVDQVTDSSGVRMQRMRTRGFIREIPADIATTLMSTFWTCYNSAIRMIHKPAFLSDQETGRIENYSPFLHLCILAIGYRYADTSRPGMKDLALSNFESVFHREAKFIVDDELKTQTTTASLQALLLLADLEAGAQRYNTGWLYAGMASRLCFELGLHRDYSSRGLSDAQTRSRQLALWSCVIHDGCWALLFGRPTSIKSSDLALLSPDRILAGHLQDSAWKSTEDNLEFQIYEALISLVDLASRVTNDMSLQPSLSTPSFYFNVIALDRELYAWYRDLPDSLQLTSRNIKQAPPSLFLLHQQYYAILILLHRPFSRRDALALVSTDRDSSERLDPLLDLSRTTRFENAVRIVQMLKVYNERFDVRTMFVTGIQHATIAASAIAAASMEHGKSEKIPAVQFQYLQFLGEILQSQADRYFPAKRGVDLVLSALAGSRTMPLGNSLAAPDNPLNSFTAHNSKPTTSPSWSSKQQMVAPVGKQRMQPNQASSNNARPEVAEKESELAEIQLPDEDYTTGQGANLPPLQCLPPPLFFVETSTNSFATAIPESMFFPHERDMLGLSPAGDIFSSFANQTNFGS